MNIVDGKYVLTDFDEYVSLDKVGVISVINNRIYADVGGQKVILTDYIATTQEINETIQTILAAKSALSI